MTTAWRLGRHHLIVAQLVANFTEIKVAKSGLLAQIPGSCWSMTALQSPAKCGNALLDDLSKQRQSIDHIKVGIELTACNSVLSDTF